MVCRNRGVKPLLQFVFNVPGLAPRIFTGTSDRLLEIAVRFGGRAGTKDWMTDDAQLLRQFTEEGSQAALAELVRRRIDFVYATALRQVGGDAHLAQDVTQGVFLALARSARSLARRPILTGWFYTTTRFLAAKAVRAHRRWRGREQESHTMNEIFRQGAPEPEWDRLRPVLDEAMHELSERDREAILLRYFEGRAFAEVGAACGVNENSARMRVERALDKLRERLVRRGITSTAAALGAALASQPVIAAPAGLAATVTGAALAGAPAGGGVAAALEALKLMSMTKLKIGAVCAFVGLLGVGVYVANDGRLAAERELAATTIASARQVREIAALRAENEKLRAEIRAQAESAATKTADSAGVGQAAGGLAEQFRVLTDLHNRKVLRLSYGIQGMDQQGKISDAFAALFALTSDERDALQQAMDHARQRLGVLAAANTTVQRESENCVVFRIAPFAGGGDIYDQLLDVFSRTLGPERNAAFLTLAADQVERALGSFGAENRTLTFTRNPLDQDARGKKPAYTLQDKRVRGEGTTSEGILRFSDLRALNVQYGVFAKLLPPDF